ncbi:kinase-like protein [Hesseltinella vesiculosa]|uniref:Kinase-like protein n=1 Tax=Hesseltinella vesiculosa TaxID=101127 RepID=A0A1X2GKM7_9FUNG|nr:kinase-like protein [Hesseltinella vesiculosa]
MPPKNLWQKKIVETNSVHGQPGTDPSPPPKTPTPQAPPSPTKSPSSSSKSPPKLINHEGLLNGIGPYHFIKPLGNGKFSKVFLARHQETKSLYAIKIIDKLVHDFRVMSRLVREIHLMELLDHPNIVKLHETYETCDSLFIVMEYIQGQNLDEYLQQRGGALPEPEARHLFRQLVQAVHVCHRHWIVHRDLKTPNIMISDPTPSQPMPVLKLVDFGLGNRFGLQRLKTICGSMLYYSPEIISNQKYYGPEVDCWCLGIALFRMIAGFEPFAHAHTVGELKKDVCSCNFPMPSSIGPDLQKTIMKCLQVDRRKRMTVRLALQNDPWLTNYGAMPCPLLLSTVYDDLVQAQQSEGGELTAKDKERRTRRQLMKTMEMEQPIAPRTLIYHPVNLSTYFTAILPSTSPDNAMAATNSQDAAAYHQQHHPRYGRFVTNVEGFRSDLLQAICSHTHKLSFKPVDKWQAMAKSRHLGFKANEFSLSAMVQRMQDQIHYFQVTLPPAGTNVTSHSRGPTPSPTTPSSPTTPTPSLAMPSSGSGTQQQLLLPSTQNLSVSGTSSSSAMSLPRPTSAQPMTIAQPVSNAAVNVSQDQLPSLTLSSITTSCSSEEPLESLTSSCSPQQLSPRPEAIKVDEECMCLLKQTCQLMGISFVQQDKHTLVCVLTLRDAPTPSTTHFTSASQPQPTVPSPSPPTPAPSFSADPQQQPANGSLNRQGSKRSTTSTQYLSISSSSSNPAGRKL